MSTILASIPAAQCIPSFIETEFRDIFEYEANIILIYRSLLFPSLCKVISDFT